MWWLFRVGYTLLLVVTIVLGDSYSETPELQNPYHHGKFTSTAWKVNLK